MFFWFFCFLVFMGFCLCLFFLDKIQRVGIIGDDVCWRVVVVVRIVFLDDRGEERGEVHSGLSEKLRRFKWHVVLIQRIDCVDLMSVVGPVELWNLQIELFVILILLIEVDFVLKALRMLFKFLGESFHVEGTQQVGSVIVANGRKELLIAYIVPNLRKRLRAHRWSHDVNHGSRVLLRLVVIAFGAPLYKTRGLKFNFFLKVPSFLYQFKDKKYKKSCVYGFFDFFCFFCFFYLVYSTQSLGFVVGVPNRLLLFGVPGSDHLYRIVVLIQ